MGFQVTVHNIMQSQLSQCLTQLICKGLGHILIKCTALFEELLKISAGTKLKNQVVIILGLNKVLKMDDILMFYFLQYQELILKVFLALVAIAL